MNDKRRQGKRWSLHTAIPAALLALALAPAAALAAWPPTGGAPIGGDACPTAAPAGPGGLVPAQDVEVTSSGPAERMVVCDSGGDGATSCETKRTMNLGFGAGWVSGCGITCNVGYYACCQEPRLEKRASCECYADPYQRPPTSPPLPSPDQPVCP